MSDPKPFPGLKLRLEAAKHLNKALSGAPFNPIGAQTLPEGRERALANRIVTLALRRHGQISHILAQALKKGIPQRSGLLEAVLRTGIAQLLYMDDIPDHSVLHLSVEAARSEKRARRFDRLVNGVLRSVQRERRQNLALPGDLLIPAWIAKKWRDHYGADAVERFISALLEGAPLDLTLMPDAGPGVRDALGGLPTLGNSVRLQTRDASVSDLPGYSEGAWWVQDTAAALPANLLGVRKGERVLDLCAAPGGKTAQLAAMGAEVTALDISDARMERVRENLSRLGLCAELAVGDALTFAPDEKFDAILLDAPCTATGTFRRHPEVLWHTRPEGVADRAGLQQRLLMHAATLLKPGGRLVYCVCSLFSEEGEAHSDWIRAHLPALAPSPISPAELEDWAAPILANGTLRLTPALEVPGPAQGTLDGFFIARFTKIGENVLN